MKPSDDNDEPSAQSHPPTVGRGESTSTTLIHPRQQSSSGSTPSASSSSSTLLPSAFVTGRLLAAELLQKKKEQQKHLVAKQEQDDTDNEKEEFDTEDTSKIADSDTDDRKPSTSNDVVLPAWSDTRSSSSTTTKDHTPAQQQRPQELFHHHDHRAHPPFPHDTYDDDDDDATVLASGTTLCSSKQHESSFLGEREEDCWVDPGGLFMDDDRHLHVLGHSPLPMTTRTPPRNNYHSCYDHAVRVKSSSSTNHHQHYGRSNSAGALSSSELLLVVPPQHQEDEPLDHDLYGGYSHHGEQVVMDEAEDEEEDHNSMTSALDELEDLAMEQERIFQIRSIVRQEIEKRIQAKCVSLSSLDPRQEGCNPSMVESMSRRVEGQLYAIKESLESYIDLSTLDSRLQNLALAKQQLEQQAQLLQAEGGGEQGDEVQELQVRRDQEGQEEHHHAKTPPGAAASSSRTLPLYPPATNLVPMTSRIPGDHPSMIETSTSATSTTRTEHLVQVLGGIGRYRQIQKLLQEIREEQENLEQAMVLRNQTTHQDSHSPAAAIGTTSPSNSSRKRKRMIMQMTLKDDETPDPIKDLYLETQELQHTFEMVPMELLGNIDWTLLIGRTQTILRTFRNWNGDVSV